MDIVERMNIVREGMEAGLDDWPIASMIYEYKTAANEIERLRKERDELNALLKHDVSSVLMDCGNEIAKLREKLRFAEEALVVAEQFVDRHSEEWYLSGQRDLTQIREALAKIREVK